MKQALLVFLLINFTPVTKGQNKNVFFFNEFCASVNKINSFTNYTYKGVEKRIGFGLGCYHTYKNEKPLNLRFGIELNYLRYFVKNINGGLSGNGENYSYTANFLTLPVGLRYNIGKKVRAFIESGISMEASVGGRRKGTEYRTDFDNPGKILVFDINDHKSPLTDGLSYYLGVGCIIPFSKFEFIIKPEIKYQMVNQSTKEHVVYNRLMIGLKLK